jgi:hypothetical protein
MSARPLIPILPASGYAELLELTGLGGSRLAKLFRRDELEHATTFIVTLACEPIEGCRSSNLDVVPTGAPMLLCRL